ncbi:hypothetical protein PG999_006306 [Apiospora kogelbergensis]|uniref:Involucrin repeat protein n=1 Tax=Apiospora kogelbergensis TaxID=1337665 RepID=A0AAW0QRS1_9PEZI
MCRNTPVLRALLLRRTRRLSHSEEPPVATIEELSVPSFHVEVPVKAPANATETALEPSIASPLEDEIGAGPSEELPVFELPEPEAASLKKSKKDKRKKKQASSWDNDLGELPTTSQNEPTIIPSTETSPEQANKDIVETPSDEQDVVGPVPSAVEKENASSSEQIPDATPDKPKEKDLEALAPVQRSKKDEQADSSGYEVSQETAPNSFEAASAVVEEPTIKSMEIPIRSANEVSSEPVDATIPSIVKTSSRNEDFSELSMKNKQESSLEDSCQPPLVEGPLDGEHSANHSAGIVEAAPALDVTRGEDPSDFTPTKKSKKDKKNRAVQIQFDSEALSVAPVEESAFLQDRMETPPAIDEAVSEALVYEGHKEPIVDGHTEELTVEESPKDLNVEEISLSTNKDPHLETESPGSMSPKKSKTDKQKAKKAASAVWDGPATEVEPGSVSLPEEPGRNMDIPKEKITQTEVTPESAGVEYVPKDAIVSENEFPESPSPKKSKKDKKRSKKASAAKSDEPEPELKFVPAIKERELQDQGETHISSEPLAIGGATAVTEEGVIANQPAVSESSSIIPLQIEATEQRASDMPAEDEWTNSFTAKISKEDKKRKGKTNVQLESEPSTEMTSLPLPDSAKQIEVEATEPMQVEALDKQQTASFPRTTSAFQDTAALDDLQKAQTSTPTDIDTTQVGVRDTFNAEPEFQAPKDVAMEDPVPGEELPVTSAPDEWADYGATKKSKKDKKKKKAAATLEPETTPVEHISDTHHSLTAMNNIPNDNIVQASLPEPATEQLLSDELTPLEAVTRGASTEPMMTIDQPRRNVPVSTGAAHDEVYGATPGKSKKGEIGSSATTHFEAKAPIPTPATPERASTQHQQLSSPIDVDLSPAQLSSHIDHEPPFDQSTQPGKKVRLQSFLDDTIVSEPISATPEIAASYQEDGAREVVALPGPEATVGGDIKQPEEVPAPDSVAREFAASYFDKPASSEESRTRDTSLKRYDSLVSPTRGDTQYNALPAMTPQRDLAISYFEKGPDKKQKYAQDSRNASTGAAKEVVDELQALLAAGALAGGQSRLSKRAKGKKSSKDAQKTASQEEGIHGTVGDKTEDKTNKRVGPILPRQVEDATSDSPESPIVGRGQKTDPVAGRKFPSRDSTQLDSREFQDSQNSELIRDIEELDTSEPQVDAGTADYQVLEPTSSRDMGDFRRRSTMSLRSLPPVEEETHEDMEADMRGRPQQGHVPRTPEVNRDSGFMADSPNPIKRSRFEDETQRDSGVHLRTLDEGARLSWASTDSRGTNKSEERRVKKSPLGDDAPRLSQYSVRSGSRSPPADKTDLLEPQKPRTPGPASRTSLAGGAQRSVSDNVRPVGTATPEGQEAPLRRSVSNTSISRLRTPEALKLRPESPGQTGKPRLHSSGTHTPPLRDLRRAQRMSGDLRSLGQHDHHGGGGSQSSLHSLDNNPNPTDGPSTAFVASTDRHRAAQSTTPVANEGRVRASKDMAECYDGMGEGRIGSPRSPTRPQSMRRRQSMQVLELESKVEQLIAENRTLAEAKFRAESNGNQRAAVTVTERDAEIEQLKGALDGLRREVQRLTEVNTGLNSANNQLALQHNDRYSRLESQHNSAAQELQQFRGQYDQKLREKDAEIRDLLQQLEATKQQVRQLQQQILATKPADAEFLRLKDEDHFDHRCQQLCAHVQQWVLRFSKFSDMRACRLTSEINDEKIIDRLDNSMLDGTDVDEYLSDRVRRRDVFMSMTMNMIWEFVFTRYLFGMDREQRQKLKSLEKLLSDAVRQWRAVTLTLLSKRPAFGNQRNEDTEAVVQAILQTLSMILPPPSNLEDQIQSQLRRVMREAVDLSIEMRTQRAEYMMLPPLQPQYDASGDIAETVTFNAALMNERSGSAASNEDLEAQHALVRSVLFPLVVKKGDDNGVGDDEIVIFPAQVLIAKPRQPAARMVTPSSENGGVPLSRGATPSSRRTTPSVMAKSVASLPMSPRNSPLGSR